MTSKRILDFMALARAGQKIAQYHWRLRQEQLKAYGVLPRAHIFPEATEKEGGTVFDAGKVHTAPKRDVAPEKVEKETVQEGFGGAREAIEKRLKEEGTGQRGQKVAEAVGETEIATGGTQVQGQLLGKALDTKQDESRNTSEAGKAADISGLQEGFEGAAGRLESEQSKKPGNVKAESTVIDEVAKTKTIPENPAGPPTEEPTPGAPDLFFLRQARGPRITSSLPRMKIPKDAFGPRTIPEDLEKTKINSDVFPQPEEVMENAPKVKIGRSSLPRLGDLQRAIPELEADQEAIKTLEDQFKNIQKDTRPEEPKPTPTLEATSQPTESPTTKASPDSISKPTPQDIVEIETALSSIGAREEIPEVLEHEVSRRKAITRPR